MRRLILIVSLVFITLAAEAQPPVATIVDGRMMVSGASGSGSLPVMTSADLSRPLHSVLQAVIAIHGARRNADVYFRNAERARDGSGVLPQTTLLIAPQFVTDADLQAHPNAGDVLRWTDPGWKQGDPALGPAALSSFEVLDSLLATLADTERFPALKRIVIAGHSAGAQLVQRYAVVGRGDAALAGRKIALRYVVANPSSYLWFGTDRPHPAAEGVCPSFDEWKYGFRGAPAYVGETRGMERRYIARDVVYLLGEQDRDPNHASLDRSCAAMTQGATRYERGMQHFFNLELRRPNMIRQKLFAVPGVAHDFSGIAMSVCGMAALFDRPGCPGY